MGSLFLAVAAVYALGTVYSYFKTDKTWAEAAKWPLRLFKKEVQK
jgi:hypothetical protein